MYIDNVVCTCKSTSQPYFSTNVSIELDILLLQTHIFNLKDKIQDLNLFATYDYVKSLNTLDPNDEVISRISQSELTLVSFKSKNDYFSWVYKRVETILNCNSKIKKFTPFPHSFHLYKSRVLNLFCFKDFFVDQVKVTYHFSE